MRLFAFDATFAIVHNPPFILLCNLQLSVHLRILGPLNNVIPVLSESPPIRPKTLVIDHMFFSPFFHTLSAPCTHAQLHVNQYCTVVCLWKGLGVFDMYLAGAISCRQRRLVISRLPAPPMDLGSLPHRADHSLIVESSGNTHKQTASQPPLRQHGWEIQIVNTSTYLET